MFNWIKEILSGVPKEKQCKYREDSWMMVDFKSVDNKDGSKCFYEVHYNLDTKTYELNTGGNKPEENSYYEIAMNAVATLNMIYLKDRQLREMGVSEEEHEESINDIAKNLHLDEKEKSKEEYNDASVVLIIFPLSITRDAMFKHADSNPALVKATVKKLNELKKRGLNILEYKDNIIATDKGFYGYFFDDAIPYSL